MSMLDRLKEQQQAEAPQAEAPTPAAPQGEAPHSEPLTPTSSMPTWKRSLLEKGQDLPSESAPEPQAKPEAPAPASEASASDSSRSDPSAGGIAPVAWLYCGNMVPVPLVPQFDCVAGRDGECELVLRNREVSRQHARFSVNAQGRPIVKDLASANGVFFGEEKVSERVLELGDVIRIGPFKIEVRAQGRTELDASPDQTVVSAGDDGGLTLTGLLGSVLIPEILQQLAVHQKTGTLKVEDGTHNGLMLIEEGVLTGARWKGELGVEAAYAMCEVRSGTFTFSTVLQALGGAKLEVQISGLLLEALRRADEKADTGEGDATEAEDFSDYLHEVVHGPEEDEDDAGHDSDEAAALETVVPPSSSPSAGESEPPAAAGADQAPAEDEPEPPSDPAPEGPGPEPEPAQAASGAEPAQAAGEPQAEAGEEGDPKTGFFGGIKRLFRRS